MKRPAGASGNLRSLVLGTGMFGWAALALVAVGLIFFGSILLSTGGWQWWEAAAVHGSEHRGVVFYSYRGTNYSIDDLQSVRTGPRTVWVDPSNPATAVLSVSTPQVSDTAITLGPVLLASVFFGAGLVRSRRHQRQRAAIEQSGGSFGDGLDPGWVRDRIGPEPKDGVHTPDWNPIGPPWSQDELYLSEPPARPRQKRARR
jgi:hypothetical protein